MSQKLKNFLSPFLLSFEPLNRLFIMESLFVLNVMLFDALPKVILGIRKQTVRTNTANKKLANFGVTQIDLIESQRKRFISVLSHQLVKFFSKNTNHYKLELILMNELLESQTVSQQMGRPSEESEEKTFD